MAAGETRRLMLFLPPGSAKSTYASDLFPAWWLAQRPDRLIIAASNTGDLAKTFSRRVRGRIRQHGLTLGYGLEREAEDDWTTTEGCEYRAVGVTAAIAGRRADLGLIDDPVKSRQEADSESQRQRVWEWYQDDFMTRLKPGAAQVLIGTRWHEDDLFGRLLEREAADWRVLRIPARAEDIDDPLCRAPGAYLWGDDAYGYAADLQEKHVRAEARTWASLYQQRPAPAEGSLFQRAWLIREDPPARERMRVYGASDYAVTADGGDFTVHVVIGMDNHGKLHLLDLWREQAAADQWIEALCDLVAKWKPLAWAEETGQIRAGVGPFLDRRIRERRTNVSRRQFPTRHDKAVRAQSIIGRMAMDGLRMRPDAPWIADLEAELLSFPAGKHDDQCLAEGTMIAMADGAEKPIEAVEAGDMVATPEGPCRVLVSAVTSEDAVLMEVTFSNGAVLRATPNHPVFVDGKGYVRVDALCLNDRIQTLWSDECAGAQARPKWSNIWGIATGAIRTASIFITRGISTAQHRVTASFIGMSGKMQTVPSLPTTTSITGMATLPTTRSTTWNACRNVSTGGGIRPLSRDSRNTLHANASPLPRGTPATLAEHGIRGTASGYGQAARPFSEPVTAAALSSAPSSRGRGSAARRATSGFGYGLWRLLKSLSRASAKAAAAPSMSSLFLVGDTAPLPVGIRSPIGPRSPIRRSDSLSARDATPSSRPCIGAHTAHRSVISIIGTRRLPGRARVRNLTVERAHAFYANGVLTHNCDALGLAGQLLDIMAVGQGPKAKPAPRDRWAKPKAEGTSWKVL